MLYISTITTLRSFQVYFKNLLAMYNVSTTNVSMQFISDSFVSMCMIFQEKLFWDDFAPHSNFLELKKKVE